MSALNGSEYVVVNDAEVKVGVGCITQWSLGKETDRKTMLEIWTRYGLQGAYPLPEISDEAALLRKACDARAKGDMLCRPRKKREEGLELVRVVKTEGQPNDYKLEATFKLNKVFRPECTPSWSDLKQVVIDDFDRLATVLTNSDIAGFIVDIAYKLGAVSLRDGGGTYFLPAYAAHDWERINAALREANPEHKLYRIPCMKTASAIEAILSSLKNEAEKMNRDLEACISDPELGARSLTSRANEAHGVAVKVRKYEEFLGVQVEGLAASFDKLREKLTEAAVRVEAEKRRQDAA